MKKPGGVIMYKRKPKLFPWILLILLLTVFFTSLSVLLFGAGVPQKILKARPEEVPAFLYDSFVKLQDKVEMFQASDFFPGLRTETEDGLPVIGGRKSGIINILLIGQDQRPGEEDGRSDSMILCSFRPRDKTLTLTSFLRDLYVDIPGHGKNRINAAYRFGGMELLDETLLKNFGIHVDGNVEVNFEQFAAIVDTLGGISVELRGDEAAELNRITGSSLSKGPAVLSGQQALHYARIRKLDADGDFSRTLRQRKILTAILNQVKSSSPEELSALAGKILPSLHTDLSAFEMVKFGGKILPMLKGLSLTSQQIPAQGTYQGQMINGMAVLVPDLTKNGQILRETLALQ